jgi:hypothetical protein
MINVILSFLNILNTLVPAIIGLAVVFFLWGLAKYVLKADDVEGRKSARQIMLWGVISIFVMVSLWGIVRWVDSNFNLVDTPPKYPTVFSS